MTQYTLKLIPTEKKSYLYKCVNNKLHIVAYGENNGFGGSNQLLVLVSDEEIKYNDYYIKDDELLLWQDAIPKYHLINSKRVIATSSKKLTPNSIISLDKQKEIVEYYNEYGVLPDIKIKPQVTLSNGFENTFNLSNHISLNSEIQFNIIQPREMNITNQQCANVNITKETCIDFGRWLFHQGIEYYDDLSNGVNYTMENRQGSFTMSQMFEIYLTIQK